MKRVLKWLAIILAGLVVSALIGVIVIQRYEKEILAIINEKLKGSVNGDFNIGDYHITILHNFPSISITLEDIYLHGPDYKTYHRALLKAERIDINVEPLKLFSKEISINSVDIEHGEIFIFRTTTGYTNLRAFKHKQRADSLVPEKHVFLNLKVINFRNVQIMYQDSLKQKNFGAHFISTKSSITSRDSALLFHIGGNIRFDGLMFNALKGSYLKNKSVQADLNMELDASSDNLLISPSSLIFEKSTVNVSGAFQLVAPGNFQLDILSDKLDYTEGLSIMPDTLAKKLSKYQIESPLKLNVLVRGLLEAGSKPAADVLFSFQDSDVTAGKITMEKMSMEGIFINHVDSTLIHDDHNSQLHFSTLRGIVDGMPVEAVLTLTDLVDPALQLKATFNVALKRLNEHLDTTMIKMTAGQFVSTFSYSGKLNEYLDDTKTRYDGRLSGEAKVSNGRFQYFTKKITVDKVNATFGFTEKRFEIKSLGLRLNNNPVFIEGLITDFIPFFINPETTGKANLKITSPRMDMEGLLVPRKIVKTKITKSASKKKISNVMEKLNEELEFNLDFHITEFINKNFKASRVKGTLVLAKNRFDIKNAMMDFASGEVELNLRLTNLQKSINPFRLKAKLRNVEISEFFYSFNNFNQTTFRHDHVDGKISLDLNLSAEINDKLEVLSPGLEAVANFKIQNGRLRGFEPMQRLSNFLFKGRDLSDVQFGEINAQISVAGTRMDISRMEIVSTAMTMFIEGRYDLKDSSDLSIQIPLSNLKKRDQDFAPENIGNDSKAGPSVFLRVRPDKNGKNTITYDPFKKFRKKKKNSNAT